MGTALVSANLMKDVTVNTFDNILIWDRIGFEAPSGLRAPYFGIRSLGRLIFSASVRKLAD